MGLFYSNLLTDYTRFHSQPGRTVFGSDSRHLELAGLLGTHLLKGKVQLVLSPLFAWVYFCETEMVWRRGPDSDYHWAYWGRGLLSPLTFPTIYDSKTVDITSYIQMTCQSRYCGNIYIIKFTKFNWTIKWIIYVSNKMKILIRSNWSRVTQNTYLIWFMKLTNED